MAQNKMEDLRNHLFAQLERLSDDELSPESLEKEIKRSDSLRSVAETIIQTAKVEVDFIRAIGATGSDSQLFKTVQTKQLT